MCVSHINESGECVAFMSRTITSLQWRTRFYKESKSNEDLNLHEFSNDEQDLEVVYRKLPKDSMCLSRINDRMALKLKAMEYQNSSLTSELDDAHAKVRRLESQNAL